jgi:hypothetical protein
MMHLGLLGQCSVVMTTYGLSGAVQLLKRREVVRGRRKEFRGWCRRQRLLVKYIHVNIYNYYIFLISHTIRFKIY